MIHPLCCANGPLMLWPWTSLRKRSTGIMPWNPDLSLEHAKIFTSKNLTDGDLSSTSDPVALA